MVDETQKPNVHKRRKAGPWNNGKAIGQKVPIPVDAIQLIRRLQAAELPANVQIVGHKKTDGICSI